MNTHCQPAARVIELCGGIEATAKIVGLDRSGVNRWRMPRARGGSGGLIPMRHARLLLATVPELKPEDLIGPLEENSAPMAAGE
jgi:hypothetical protein